MQFLLAILVMLTITLLGATRHELQSTLASIQGQDTASIPAGILPTTDLDGRDLVKRHNYALTCKSKVPPESQNWQFDLTLSRRCLASPYSYNCAGDRPVYDRWDDNCSAGCICERRLENPAPVCLKLISREKRSEDSDEQDGEQADKKAVGQEHPPADPFPSPPEPFYWCVDPE